MIEHYPVEEGILYGGEYPGASSASEAVKRIRRLVAAGIRTFVDLTAPADGLRAYQPFLDQVAEESGLSLRRISLPIPDMGVPESAERMREILAALRGAVEGGPAVYVHCWGGIGRTGTVIGCWLRECGSSPQEALDRVQELYRTHMPKARYLPESPQTAEQKQFVRTWHPLPPEG